MRQPLAIGIVGDRRLGPLEGRARVGHRRERTEGVRQTDPMPKRRVRRSPPPKPPAPGHFRRDGAPKTRYPTQREAADAAHLRWVVDRVELEVYRCDLCAGWHMGKRFRDP